MPPPPCVSGTRLVRALERHGFTVARDSGSHHIMRHPDARGTTVRLHGNPARSQGHEGILKDVGMTINRLPVPMCLPSLI